MTRTSKAYLSILDILVILLVVLDKLPFHVTDLFLYPLKTLKLINFYTPWNHQDIIGFQIILRNKNWFMSLNSLNIRSKFEDDPWFCISGGTQMQAHTKQYET